MRKRRFSEINVVPFIDILLVLLVIILTTATFIIKNQLPIDIPQATSQNQISPKSISIAINKKGDYFFEKKAISLKKLKENLSKLNPNKDLITLQADQKSQFQRFVLIIDLLKQKGFKKISILTSK